MKKLCKLLAISTLTLVAASAQASVVLINFDNVSTGTLLNTAYSGLGATFNSTAAVHLGGGGVTSQPNFAVGNYGTFNAALEITFDNYATAVGSNNVTGSSFTLSAYDINGVLLGSASTADFNTPVFLSGIGNIKTARFTTTNQYGIDDLTFNAAAADVPEPGSFALIGLGLLGFAAARRKQKQA